jgi:hypothetical protein
MMNKLLLLSLSLWAVTLSAQNNLPLRQWDTVMDSLGTNDFQVGDEIEFTHRIAPSMTWDIRGLLPQNVDASILLPNGNTVTPTSDGNGAVFGGADGIDIEISLTAIEEGLVESQYREGFAESYVDYPFTVVTPTVTTATFLANLEQTGMTVGETVSADLSLATGELYSVVVLVTTTPQVLTATVYDPATDDNFTMPDEFESLPFFGAFDITITAESVGTKVITHDNNNGSTDYNITVSPAQLDPSPWEIIVADMVANNPHEVARSYDFTVVANQLPIRLSENMDCPTETGPTRFSIEFTDIDTGEEIGVLDEKCEVVVLFPGRNVTVNFTPVSPGSDLLEWQDDNGVTQSATLTSSATPCDGPAATVASIGQDLLTNPIAVGETRSYCLLNASPGSLIAMLAPTQNSGILSATATVLSGTDTGYSVENYTGGNGSLQFFQGQDEFVRFDFTGVSAGPVLIEVETGAEFFEETITVLPAALPIELITFSGVATPKTTLLYFTTASESQNRGFHLQHSPNGQNWTTLDFIPGAGDSQTERNYNYTHQNPVPGTNFYRLEQEDYDGTRTLSEVVTAEFSGGGELSITPNPATELITVTSPLLMEGEDFTLTVYDAAGRQLLEQRNTLQLQVAELPTGIYTLLLKAGSTIQTERFVRR